MTMWHTPLKLNHVGVGTVLCEDVAAMYSPPFDLAGKTVLDVGATCGEVAYWFIKQHHAQKVICIESDPESLPFLYANKPLMNIEIAAEDFNIKHLRDFKYDFIKCDVEGSEMILLEFEREGGILKPCILEAHTNWIRDQFLKAGFKQKCVTNNTRVQVAAYIMNNYEHLQKQWRKEHPEEAREKDRLVYLKIRDKKLAYMKEYNKRRAKNEITYLAA